MSATHSTLGPLATNFRSTRSGAGRADRSRRVVTVDILLLTPLSVFFHQPGHSLPTDSRAFLLQLSVYPWRSVRLSRQQMNRPDPLLNLFVLSGPDRHHPLAPRVVPAGGDFQHTAHRADREDGLVRAHEREDPFDFFSVS